jgi:sugar phosphate isomerase/epimerase
MFKIAAFTDEISQDLEHACDVLAKFGGEGLELRGVWKTNCAQFTDDQIRDIKRIAADKGMKVCSLGSPFGKCDLDNADEVQQHVDMLKRLGDVARELDCPIVRGFAFWDRDQVDEKPWDRMIAAYESVPDILEEKGVVLGLENEAACYVGTAKHTRTFLDRLGSERVKAIWDPANHVQDIQSADIPAWPDGYNLVKDDLVHVHVKDAAITDEGRPNVFLGYGEAQWNKQFAAFKKDGYDGYVSLETHVKPDRLPEELKVKYAELLAGDEREVASQICLAWMRDARNALL